MYYAMGMTRRVKIACAMEIQRGADLGWLRRAWEYQLWGIDESGEHAGRHRLKP